MKKITFSLLLILCSTINLVFSQTDTLFKISDKWKQNLVLNGKIYLIEDEKKALDDYDNGKSNYPVCLPSYIDASFDDVNFDGKKDVLFYFYPIDILHGTGMIDQSDFAVLVCSNQDNFEIIDDFTELIKSKILNYYKDFQSYSVTVDFDGLRNGFIAGSFSTWIDEDAHCCPSYVGTFEYDYLRKSIKIYQD